MQSNFCIKTIFLLYLKQISNTVTESFQTNLTDVTIQILHINILLCNCYAMQMHNVHTDIFG